MSEEKSIKDLINSMMDSYHMTDKMLESKVKRDWEIIVGKTISKNTRKLNIHNKILYLEITSAPLRSDLYYHEQIIVEKVNQHAGQTLIERIKVK